MNDLNLFQEFLHLSRNSLLESQLHFRKSEEEEIPLVWLQLGVLGGDEAVVGDQLSHGNLDLNQGKALPNAQAGTSCVRRNFVSSYNSVIKTSRCHPWLIKCPYLQKL